MKFQLDFTPALQVRSYGAGWIELVDASGVKRITSAVILNGNSILPWEIFGFDELTEQHFSDLLLFNPELVLLGTGSTHHSVHPRLLQRLSQSGIGLEAMNTPAACRTWNYLRAEGRLVLAALLMTDAQSAP